MKTASFFRASVCFIALTLLSACAPDAGRNASAAGGVVLSGVVRTGEGRALVLYAAGDVSVTGPDGWRAVAVGELLERGQSVKTGARTVCELQFGGRAAIRIEELTEVCLDSVSVKDGGTDIGLKAAAGTVLCKVGKLSGDERFEVKTRSAICGVRGTEFGVTMTGKDETVLAVRRGTVAVRPAALDLERLKAALKSENPEVADALLELGRAERIVAEGQSLAVGAAAQAAAEKSLAGVESAIRSISGVETPDAARKEKFKAVIRKAKAELEKQAEAPRPQTDGERETLERIDDLSKRLLSAVAAGEDEERYRVSLSATPEDAAIFFGSEFLGYGRFQGLFAEGEKLEFTITKPGFTPRTLSVEAGPEATGQYDVALEQIWAETGTGIGVAEAGTVETRDAQGRVIEVTLGRQETLLPAGGLGLEFFPSGGVTLLGREPYRLLVPIWGQTFMLEGDDLRNLSTASPVLGKGGKGSIDNLWTYLEAVYRHTDGRLYGFYHAFDGEGFEGEKRVATEPGPMWYGRIAVAVSDDGGLSWTKKGAIIESALPKEWKAYEGQTTRGVADVGLVREKNGRYLYLYYSEYSRVSGNQVHVCLARADIRERPPLPGAWTKYCRGGFGENGLGGRETPVIDSKYMDGADTEQPHAFYSRSLGCYVMVYGIYFWKEHIEKRGLEDTGVYISYSDDGIGWSRGYRLLKAFVVPLEGREFVYYPSVVLDQNSANAGWLLYGYSERFIERAKKLVPFYLAGRSISLKRRAP